MVSLEWCKLQPTGEQLVSFLEMKRLDPAFDDPIIKELNIYKYHPRELLGFSSMSNEQVCYFLCTLDPKGKLKNRKAKGGSWKITCKDIKVMAEDSKKQIGIRKTLSFYEGSTTTKENRTDWKMYEYHEYPRKDNSSSQGEVVVCRIEKKPDKKRKSSSALDQGQTSDSLANDFGNNVPEDFLQVEPQIPQNLHLLSSYNNNAANSNLMEVETQPPSNQHISSHGQDDVAKNIVPEMESQLLPNQHVSPTIGEHIVKATESQIESQPLANRQLSSNMENHAAKSLPSEGRPLFPAQQDELIVCTGPGHNSFSTWQWPLHMTPGFSYSSSFTNDLVPMQNQNSFSALHSPVNLPPGCLYCGGSSNNSTDGLHLNFLSTPHPELSYFHSLPWSSQSIHCQNPHTQINGLDYISALQSPVYTPPGSSYSSCFSNDSNVWTPQFAAEQEDGLANSYGSAQDDFHKLY